MNIGLYIHIPFCVRKCHYCDFPSYPELALAESYCDALVREARQRAKELANVRIQSVFIGGGTPTCLSLSQLARIFREGIRCFTVMPDAEITVEANPGTVDGEKLMTLKALGVNRLSLGIQAFQDALLQKIGRLHSAEEAIAAFRLARKAGFTNINIDLMFGLPGQTMLQWRETCGMARELAPEHIAAYNLKIEPGTPFDREYASGRLNLPGEDVELAMYDFAEHYFAAGGYVRYEISNFSRPGFASRHNLLYWHNGPYLGLGAAAHSYLHGCRTANVRHPAEYIRRMSAGISPVAEQETPSPAQEMGETVMLALRLREGLDRKEFIGRFGRDVTEIYREEINRLISQDLVELTPTRLRLTARGTRLGNRVFMAFLP